MVKKSGKEEGPLLRQVRRSAIGQARVTWTHSRGLGGSCLVHLEPLGNFQFDCGRELYVSLTSRNSFEYGAEFFGINYDQ